VPKRVIVFDGDDTLWFVEPLYDQARHEARAIVEAAGHDGSRWEHMQRLVDVENVVTMGTQPERFPTSCAQAYEAIARLDAVESRPDVVIGVRNAARTVFERAAIPNDDALPVLAALRPQYSLALLTKGDPAIQAKRIHDAGVGDSFDHVEIVTEKTLVEFATLLGALDTAPPGSWSVGNSLASDINPAVRLGMFAIWVDAPVWEHERRERKPAAGTVVAESLRQVPEIVRTSNGSA